MFATTGNKSSALKAAHDLATTASSYDTNNSKLDTTTWVRIDSFIVEMIASFFVCSVCVMHWVEPDHASEDWSIQFLPPLSWGVIMLTIHDREGWFPDTSSFMTIIQWALGSYPQWDQPLVRIAGQFTGMALCIALLSVHGVTTRDLTERHEENSASIFVLNVAATFLDHVAAMYIILPLLPFFNSSISSNNNNSNIARHKHLHTSHASHVKPTASVSSSAASVATVDRIALPAFVFAGVHWTLWKTFASEMNPLVTFVVAVQRGWQLGTYDEPAWIRAGCAMGGQCVGLLGCILYIIFCIPKVHSMKESY